MCLILVAWQAHADYPLVLAANRDEFHARAAAPASAAAANPPGGMSFEAIPLEVSLRGRYDALLAAIRELALAPLPMQIEIAAVERTGPDPTAPRPPRH